MARTLHDSQHHRRIIQQKIFHTFVLYHIESPWPLQDWGFLLATRIRWEFQFWLFFHGNEVLILHSRLTWKPTRSPRSRAAPATPSQGTRLASRQWGRRARVLLKLGGGRTRGEAVQAGARQPPRGTRQVVRKAPWTPGAVGLAPSPRRRLLVVVDSKIIQ